MYCLVFLLRVELALRGIISFLQAYGPVVLVNSEAYFLVFKEYINEKPRSGYGENTWCSVYSLSHLEFTRPSCQYTIDLIKFHMDWYEEISVGVGEDFL